MHFVNCIKWMVQLIRLYKGCTLKDESRLEFIVSLALAIQLSVPRQIRERGKYRRKTSRYHIVYNTSMSGNGSAFCLHYRLLGQAKLTCWICTLLKTLAVTQYSTCVVSCVLCSNHM